MNTSYWKEEIVSLVFLALVSVSFSVTVSNCNAVPSFFRLDEELLRLKLTHDRAMMTSLVGPGLPRWLSIIDLKKSSSFIFSVRSVT